MTKCDAMPGLQSRAGRAAAVVFAFSCLAALASAPLLTALAEPGNRNADAPRLSLPIACEPGKSCFIQSRVDIDPGPQARDFRCGSTTYDGHKGVDFRLLSTQAAKPGVSVLAAADGVVARSRDGMQDVFVTPQTMDEIRPRGCGNSIVLDHGRGWRTAYCHMRKGSLAVKPGSRVKRGDRLGDVGYSGLVEFAHLHFMVLHNGKVVDPESGLQVGEACREDAGGEVPGSLWPGSLWDDAAQRAFAYRNGELIGAGFAAKPPATALLEHDHRVEPPAPDAKALLFYARLINLRQGDRIALTLRGPAGLSLQSTTEPLDRSKATYVAYLGRKLRAPRWPPGRYEGAVRLIRDGREIAVRQGIRLDLP